MGAGVVSKAGNLSSGQRHTRRPFNSAQMKLKPPQPPPGGGGGGISF